MSQAQCYPQIAIGLAALKNILCFIAPISLFFNTFVMNFLIELFIYGSE